MSSQWSSFPVRLLSSVAVVGRDNEPIYLRGSLSDSIFSSSPFVASTNNKLNDDDQPPPAAAAASSAVEERAEWSGSDDDDEGDNNINNNNNNNGGGGESSTAEENASSSNNKPGLFGRIKGAVIRKNDEGDNGGADASTSPDKKDGDNSNTTNVIDDDDDPFGFFGSSSTSSSSQVDTMSLTQQLVLHASLDRFEEKMTSRPNNNNNNNIAARWRSPGAMGTNAMWMGMLCEVEERLRLYGYITNTGIKFILLLEIIHMNEDGSSSRCHDLSSSSVSVSSSLPSRETELKHIFAQLHDLYVRYTMNPFTKLRGPIKSRVFDQGIGEIARSFNSSAIEQAVQNGEANNGEGLAWM